MAQARPKQASRKRPSGRPAVPPALWAMVGAVVILFAGLLIWLSGREPQPEQVGREARREPPPPVSDKPGPSRQDARAVAAAPAKEPPKELTPPPPRYEFYHMLPAQKVEAPLPAPGHAVEPPAPVESPTDAPPRASDASPVQQSAAVVTTRFELQVGSFRRYEEADRRKAELAMLGYSASIQSANVNGENWHRVKIGPLPEAEARRANERLKAVGMNPLVVKKSG
ncbi:MAG: SPOR domain-containing protein [Pseudomonadota bacterium]